MCVYDVTSNATKFKDAFIYCMKKKLSFSSLILTYTLF